MNWHQVLWAATIVLISPGLATATCDRIKGPLDYADRSLLWLDHGKWVPVKNLNSTLGDGKKKTLKFAYIIRDRKDLGKRKGVVVVKSGFSGPQTSGNTQYNSVQLHRPRTKDACRKSAYNNMQAQVSTKAYDDYHDRGIKTGSDEAFSRFHITYESMQGCRRSNDSSADSFFKGNLRSNRSQFSFDPTVVAKGQYRHLFGWFRLNSAYANEISGRAVQIRKYQADTDGLACVTFRATVGPGAFLRVNDLESRTILGDDGAEWSYESGRNKTLPR